MTDVKIVTADDPRINASFDTYPVVFVSHVESSNIAKDIRENIRNLTGGRMQHYEDLMQRTVTRAFQKFESELAQKGYDGAYCVRLNSPSIVDGGCEVTIYGTPYRKISI